MDIEVIKKALEEFFEDEYDLECQYDAEKKILISPDLKLETDIVFKKCRFVVNLFEDGFSFKIFCANYEPIADNMSETMTFIGLCNNALYPGTMICYNPRSAVISISRYVDCYSIQNQVPAKQKIHRNFNIAVSGYQEVMDLVLAVNSGNASAVDAFKTLLNHK